MQKVPLTQAVRADWAVIFELRGRDSNPGFAVQSRASYQLDDPALDTSRIASSDVPISPPPEPMRAATPRPDGRRTPTKARVEALARAGRTVTEIAAELGLSAPTICHHLRSLGYPPSRKFAKRYDWAAVQRYYDAGHERNACQERFGFTKQAWHAAVRRGEIVPRPHLIPVEQLLVVGRTATKRNHLKLRLVGAGLKSNRCEECGITEWRERPLSMALHHRNGDRNDNRLANLQMLCPNCHSQTHNFGGRNRGRTVRAVR